MRRTFFGAAVSLLTAAPLQAAPGDPDALTVSTESAIGNAPPRNYFNLRIGGAASRYNGRTEICGEGAPTPWLAVEGCGNGSEILHNDPDVHLTHIMAKLRLAAWRVGRAWLEPRAGLGFAELQVADDKLGFNFFDAGASGESTAGPEAGLFMRAVVPATRRLELILELRGSMAWLHHAPRLALPKSRLQPSAGFTAGFGF